MFLIFMRRKLGILGVTICIRMVSGQKRDLGKLIEVKRARIPLLKRKKSRKLFENNLLMNLVGKFRNLEAATPKYLVDNQNGALDLKKLIVSKGFHTMFVMWIGDILEAPRKLEVQLEREKLVKSLLMQFLRAHLRFIEMSMDCRRHQQNLGPILENVKYLMMVYR